MASFIALKLLYCHI